MSHTPITFEDEDCGNGKRVLRMMQGTRIVGVCGWYENGQQRDMLRHAAMTGFNAANDCISVRKAELG